MTSVTVYFSDADFMSERVQVSLKKNPAGNHVIVQVFYADQLAMHLYFAG